MKRTVFLLIAFSLLFTLVCVPVLAEDAETNGEEQEDEEDSPELLEQLREQIELLKRQIKTLMDKIQSLRRARQETKEAKKEVKETLRLTRQLWRGTRGENVELLQEFLATDPDIYPEGLVTGYFGPLTYRAVKRFQKKAGIEQVGRVGPKTTSKINELLEEGAGKSGKVPPGLLIAPGIRKKIGYTPEPPEDQVLPPGIEKKLGDDWKDEKEDEDEEEEEDLEIIGDVNASSSAKSATISWTTNKEADSKVYYDTTTPLEVNESTSMVSSPDLVLDHLMEISGLESETTYYYLVTSADEAGNNATSTEASFETKTE